MPLSAVTVEPIPGSSISPALDDRLPADQLVEVQAPGYYTLHTTVGHLRSKGNRIYLIPLSFDREYFDAFYGGPRYTAPIYQWGRNPLRIQLSSELAVSTIAVRSLDVAIAAMNSVLDRMDSPLRMAAGGGASADFLVELRPSLPPGTAVSGLLSVGPPERGTFGRAGTGERFFAQGNIYVRDIESAAKSHLLYRILFFFCGPTNGDVISPNRGFLSRSGYDGFQAPNEQEIAIVRAYLNRCGGGLLRPVGGQGPTGTYQNGIEDERVVTPCVTPPGN